MSASAAAGEAGTHKDAVRARTTRSAPLRTLEVCVSAYALALVLGSIWMFMMGGTSARIGELINEQNEAALKLWDNLDYYSQHRLMETADKSLPPGLFGSLVDFSRRNAGIVKNVHRLNPHSMFSRSVAWAEVCRFVVPADGRERPRTKVIAAAGEEALCYFPNLGVDPRTDSSNVVERGFDQIELYQAIRDYAQDQSAFYTEFLGAISKYLLPVMYALLGAFLFTFRPLRRRQHADADICRDRVSRFVMAAIAGITISVLGSLMLTDSFLSPLAVAFLCGYSIDAFMSQLDGVVAKLTKPAG